MMMKYLSGRSGYSDINVYRFEVIAIVSIEEAKCSEKHWHLLKLYIV